MRTSSSFNQYVTILMSPHSKSFNKYSLCKLFKPSYCHPQRPFQLLYSARRGHTVGSVILLILYIRCRKFFPLNDIVVGTSSIKTSINGIKPQLCPTVHFRVRLTYCVQFIVDLRTNLMRITYS